MFKKGQSGNPAGRPSGANDKTNQEIREAFRMLVQSNLPNIEAWIKSVAKDNPTKALEILLKFSEYVIPKLKATECKVSGSDSLVINLIENSARYDIYPEEVDL